MPKPQLSATVTTTRTVETALAPKLKEALVVKVAEHAKLQAEIDALTERQTEIKAEVEAAFKKAGQFGLLVDGVKVNGEPVKLVCGSHTTTDKEAIRERLLELGEEDPMWIEHNAEEKKPSKPYMRIGLDKRARAKKGHDE